MNNASKLASIAEKQGIPLRSLEDVRDCLARDKARARGKNVGIDIAVANLMLKHGRLTDEARAYVERYVRN